MNNYDMSNKMVSTRIHFIAFYTFNSTLLIVCFGFFKNSTSYFSIYLVFKFYDSRINAK